MRLSAKILKNVNNVNSWSYTSQAYMTEGQPNTLYLQLVDLNQVIGVLPEKSPVSPENPIRYISQAVSLSVFVKFSSIDDDTEFEITGSQPFSQDRSIWRFDLLSTQVPNSGYIQVRIMEDGVERKFNVKNAISVETIEIGSC